MGIIAFYSTINFFIAEIVFNDADRERWHSL